jgi:pilus assembly protein CpaE
MAADWSLRAALISHDPRFRSVVREAFAAPELGVNIGVELSERFADFGEEQIKVLRQLNPELVVIDLEDDPELGVKFTQFLSQSSPGIKVIAGGPSLSQDVLLSAMRAGVADYLHKPFLPEAIADAVRRVVQTMGRAQGKTQRKPGLVYSFFSPKGGAGSTTVATNFAVVLHRISNKRTLLVDLDLELGEVALALGVQPRFNLVDMVQNFHRMDAGLLASYIEQHSSGVHLLGAPFHPERAEMTSADDIRKILHFLKQHYDYVVVDTSKSFSPPTMAAFDQSDLVFLVSNIDLPSLRNIQRGLPLLKRVLPRGADQIRLVVNRYSPDIDISVDEVQSALGLKVYWTLANDYDAVIGSLNTGQPIVLNGTSKYARDLKQMGADMAGLGKKAGKDGSADGGIAGVWRKMFRRPEEAKP